MALLDRHQRTTRGKRMSAAVEEEDGADSQFWNQEFFAEEGQDDDYATEEEEEDVIDSDFDVEENDEDDDEAGDENERPKKKAMKPPGAPAPKPKPKPKPPKEAAAAPDKDRLPAEVDGGGAEAAEAASAAARQVVTTADYGYEAPTLRRSTVVRIAQAEKERQRQEKAIKRRPATHPQSTWKPLTQQELLAEAARTEVENIQSLKVLLALEEETKRKAMVVKQKYTGPLVKFHSAKVNGEEKTTLEPCNTYRLPAWMERRRVEPAYDRNPCAITGLPAPYTDPRTGCAFANAVAFKRLRTGAGPLPHTAAVQHQPVADAQAAGCKLGVDASSLLAEEGMPGPAVPQGRRTRCGRRPNRSVARVAAQLLAPVAPAAQRQQQGRPDKSSSMPLDVMALMLDLHKSLQ